MEHMVLSSEAPAESGQGAARGDTAMADQRATLIIKLGDSEIRYEAEREAVEAQLEQLVAPLLRSALQSPLSAEIQAAYSPATTPPPAPAPLPAAPEPPEAQLLKQLYEVSGGGRLRLRKLPDRAADALLLVLYGMRKLQDRTWVYAPGMTAAARASGLRFGRADKLLAACSDLIDGFGKRRGKRYRLTAAGRAHCARLVRDLVDPAMAASAQRSAAEAAVAPRAEETGIPEKVTSRWHGELLTVAETAQLLGVTEAEVRSLRFRYVLLGLPGGTRKRRRFFCPAFQFDAERREIYPQVQRTNLLVYRRHTSWGIAAWWSKVEPRLGRKPMELIGTPEADAVVEAAIATFVRRE